MDHDRDGGSRTEGSSGSDHAQVAVAAPLRGLYSYRVPVDLVGQLQPGQLVEVPFGKGVKRGVLVGIDACPPADLELKSITGPIEPGPVIGPGLLRTLLFAADYYLVPPGEMIFAALPPPFRRPGKALVLKHRLRAEPTGLALPATVAALRRRAPRQAALLERLLGLGSAEVSALERESPGARVGLKALEAKGLVRLHRPDREDRPGPIDLPAFDPVERLTSEQQAALDSIQAGQARGGFASFLLHGVTGSGKTEVYLRAIERVLRSGRGAILLVPEIALTPQLTHRVSARLGDQVAVLHSGLGQAERLTEWRRLQTGRAKVALGARSAVFAPVRELGLVVVDEEHDSSYKQSERLPYNGRDLALVRAREEGALALLGSATPSLEAVAHARSGRFQLLALPKRVCDRPLPVIETVDLRKEFDPRERVHALGPRLAEALAKTLDAGEQAILFLNRRGYSSFALCRDCGQAIRCTNCSVALVHHLMHHQLRCHYCGLTVRLPLPCPDCGSGRVQLFGLGTQKCEAEVRRRFPGARVLRLDSDSAAGRGAVQDTLGRFARGQADVLVGTQMVTKGHDIPGVTLVGVVLADLGLHLPDFRAAERTFQLLLQVAGRAGRGERAGRVIVQTFLPAHESIVLAKENRFDEFYEREIARRQALGYPPARRLLMIRVSHPQAQPAAEAAAVVAALVRQESRSNPGRGKVLLLGPVVSPLARLRGRYRWQMLVKCDRTEDLQRTARRVLQRLRPLAGAKILFDVDPVDML